MSHVIGHMTMSLFFNVLYKVNGINAIKDFPLLLLSSRTCSEMMTSWDVCSTP